jgi:hypothetical protein
LVVDDRQLADGRIICTLPDGHTHHHIRQRFALPRPARQRGSAADRCYAGHAARHRKAMAAIRTHTRAQNRAAYSAAECQHNRTSREARKKR